MKIKDFYGFSQIKINMNLHFDTFYHSNIFSTNNFLPLDLEAVLKENH